MGQMMGGAEYGTARQPAQQPQQPPKKKKRGLLGDIIQGATGISVP